MKTVTVNYKLVFLQTLLMVLVAPYVHAIEWDHNIVADEGNYHIYWTTEQDLITFEVQARTLGYVCFGFSAHGEMNGSDIVIGWVNGPNAELQDRLATSEDGEPAMDANQDYKLLSGSENETHTVLRFQRKIDTCDDYDYLFTRDSLYLIYAWHSHDLAQEKVTCQTENRGTVLVELFVDAEDKKIDISEVTLDILNDNVTVNPADTSYWCTFHVIPGDYELLAGNIPLIQSGHESLVHHSRLFHCSDDVKPIILEFGTSINCTSDDIHSKILNICSDFITGYTVGTASIVLPHGTGYPLGNNGKDSYYALETHYSILDNDLPPYLDNSGLQLYLNRNKSEYEAGMIFLQTNTDGTVIIPPKQESFTWVTHFPSECTSKFIPDEGINISSVIFHAHSSGRSFRLRQFRNGIELPPIFSVSNYNFDRQISYFLKPERKVLPGDFITFECNYNTEKLNASTLGGEESFNEMCISVMSHYPRIKVDNVWSGLSSDKISEIRKQDDLMSGDTGGTMTDTEFLQNYNWDDKRAQYFAEKLQKAQRDDAISVQCMQGRTPLEVVNTAYPTIASPYVEPPRKC